MSLYNSAKECHKTPFFGDQHPLEAKYQRRDSLHGLFSTTHMATDIREQCFVHIPSGLAGDKELTYLAATTRKRGVRPLRSSWSQMPGGGKHNTVIVSSHSPAAHSGPPLPCFQLACVPSKPRKQRLPKVSRSPVTSPAERRQ